MGLTHRGHHIIAIQEEGNWYYNIATREYVKTVRVKCKSRKHALQSGIDWVNIKLRNLELRRKVFERWEIH